MATLADGDAGRDESPSPPQLVVHEAAPTSGSTSIPTDAGFRELTWTHLDYSVRALDENKKPVQKQILHGLHGKLQKGRLLAVMGVSGSGKTSLLNILAGRYKDFLGEIALDGLRLDPGGSGGASPTRKSETKVPSSPTKNGNAAASQKTAWQHFLQNCAFIQQKDLMYATNTVEEHLDFYCRMLGVGREKMEEVIDLLNLNSCRSSLIGDENEGMIGKGISGGEMKRLSIAAELLREPRLVFADEPTSGLDSLLAADVVDLLKNLCVQKDCLAGCTIHQPSSEIYEKFDDLCLLAEGCVVYFGPREGAVEYFGKIGHECPKFANPADFWISLTSSRPNDPESAKRVQGLIEAWERHVGTNYLEEDAKKNSVEVDPAATLTKLAVKSELAKSRKVGFSEQTKALIGRLAVTISRHPLLTKARIGQTIFLGLIVGLIYLRTENDQQGVQNRTGSAFFVVVNQSMQNIFGLLQTFPLEKHIIVREAKSGLYSAGPYFCARTVLGLSMETVYPAAFGLITYFLIGFDIGQPGDNQVSLFLWYELILVLASIAAASLGYGVVYGEWDCCLWGREMVLMLIGFAKNDSVPALFFKTCHLATQDFMILQVVCDWVQFKEPRSSDADTKNIYYNISYSSILSHDLVVGVREGRRKDWISFFFSSNDQKGQTHRGHQRLSP